MHFDYTARTNQGERCAGTIEARDKISAIREIEKLGRVPISIRLSPASQDHSRPAPSVPASSPPPLPPSNPLLPPLSPVTTSPQQSMREESCVRPSESPVPANHKKCYEVITNVVYTGFTNYIWYADVFVFQDEIYVSNLSSPSFPQGGMAGYGADGNLLKLIGIQSGEDKLEEVREAMEEARTAAAEERRRRQGWAIDARGASRISIDAVASVSITSDEAITHNGVPVHFSPLIVMTCGNVTFHIAPPSDAQAIFERIKSWHQGMPVYIRCDTQGIELALPHPAHLFERFATGTDVSAYTSKWCADLVEQEAYCDSLLGELKAAAFEKRKAFADAIRTRSAELSRCLATRLAQSPFRLGSGLVMFILGIVVGGACLAFDLDLFIYSFIAFVVAIIGISRELNERKRNLFVANKMHDSVLVKGMHN